MRHACSCAHAGGQSCTYRVPEYYRVLQARFGVYNALESLLRKFVSCHTLSLVSALA